MFHWWYVPVGVLLVMVLLVAAWICSMCRDMPLQNCLAVFGNLKLTLPGFLKKFALSGKRDYSTLPEPLVMADGTAVSTPEQFEKRRAEILALFEEQVYGTLPKAGFTTSFEVIEEGEALGGAALRRQIKMIITTEKGSSEALMLLYLPKGNQPVPVVLGLNFRGNHTVLNDTAILPSCFFDTSGGKWEKDRGRAAYRWNIVDSVHRGYGVATIYAGDFALDKKECYANQVIGLFDEPEFKAVGAWAFGLLRGVDYLLTDSFIDHSHIAVVGHSRLGKAAVWAGANDLRIGLVISNESGNTGASLSRGNHGETVYSVNMAFPYWFCSAYAAYGKNENALPVDQNLLLAAIAPRKLYIASAEDDLWSDPQGAFNSLNSAKSAFSLYYGPDVLPDGMETYLPAGRGFACRSMGTHMRKGLHDITAEDWRFYLDYMDRYFAPEKAPA